MFLFLLIFAAFSSDRVGVPCNSLSVEKIINLVRSSSKLGKLNTHEASPSPIKELPLISFPSIVPL